MRPSKDNLLKSVYVLMVDDRPMGVFFYALNLHKGLRSLYGDAAPSYDKVNKVEQFPKTYFINGDKVVIYLYHPNHIYDYGYPPLGFKDLGLEDEG